MEMEKTCSCCIQVHQGGCWGQAEGVEGDGQSWHEWMGMDCPGARLGKKVAKSTARHYCRLLLKHLTGGVMEGKAD